MTHPTKTGITLMLLGACNKPASPQAMAAHEHPRHDCPPADAGAHHPCHHDAHGAMHHGHHAHGPMHHAHGAADGGPMVHRFERAADWVADFDNPERDAWQRPSEIVAAMNMQPGMTVADLGAGTGYFESRLSRAVGEKGTVLALDIEPDMVRHMRERAEHERWTNVRPSIVAIDDPKLPPQGVDRVLVVDVWHHIPNRVAYATKIRAGLRPGGQVFIVDFKLDAHRGPPPEHRLAPELVVRELSSAGFSARVLPTSLPEQYIVRGE